MLLEFGFLSFLSFVSVNSHCGNGYVDYHTSKKCVKVIDKRMKFMDAMTFCERETTYCGGTLVSVHNQAQSNQLIELAYLTRCLSFEGAGIWIGLTYTRDTYEYKWVDGSPVDFLNWAQGYPNEEGHAALGSSILTDGKWFFAGNDAEMCFACEYDWDSLNGTAAVDAAKPPGAIKTPQKPATARKTTTEYKGETKTQTETTTVTVSKNALAVAIRGLIDAQCSCGVTSLSARNDLWNVWSSPGYPNGYCEMMLCSYTITAQDKHFIVFSVQDFQLQKTCDYLQFYNGSSTASPYLIRLTGNMSNVQREFESQTSVVLALFVTDDSVNLPGFQISYKSVEAACSCGVRSLSAEDSSWKSWSLPGYPSNYCDNLNCTYVITAPTGHVIFFSVQDLELEKGHDYLLFYDGPSTASPQLARLTGNVSDVVRDFQSHLNVVLATFYTDGSNNYRGFQINYRSGCSCGATSLSAQENSWNSWSSPAYPNNYCNNMNCTYMITAPIGHVIVFSVQDLELERGNDYIQFYNGLSTASAGLTLLTGNISDVEREFESQWSGVLAIFHTDNSSAMRGFKINYISVAVACSCGARSLSADNSLWKSWYLPSYPHSYCVNMNCTYTITAQSGQHIIFDVVELHMESCCDYFEFYDGPSTTSGELARLTGDIIDMVCAFESQSSKVLAVFYTDNSRNYGGFQISYTSVNSSCSCGARNLSAENNTVKSWFSPHYPGNYCENMNCTYVISAQTGHIIVFNVVDLEMEDTRDYLELYDGPSIASDPLTRLTGETSDVVREFESKSNDVVALFYTDSSRNLRGFLINYVSVTAPCSCGETSLKAEDNSWKSWFSPRYPSNYCENMNCTYTITAQTGHFIAFYVSYLELQTCCDYLTFYDGLSTAVAVLKRLDGNTSDVTRVFESHSNAVLAIFQKNSSNSNNLRGFQINYQSYTASTCGVTTLSAQDDSWKTWSSPGYPFVYWDNLYCTYTITAATRRLIVFNLQDLQLEITYDYLQLFDGPSTKSPALTRLTGSINSTSREFNSSSNVVLAIFSTHNYNNFRGFQINYKSVYSDAETRRHRALFSTVIAFVIYWQVRSGKKLL